jgi:acetyltransferase-like isoleucine patch superfamily enzyme
VDGLLILRLPHFLFAFFPNLYIIHLRQIGIKVGAGTRFYGHVKIDETIPPLVEIGANCVLTDGVKILIHDYVYSVLYHIHGRIRDVFPALKTTIGNNVYVGENTVILKGVTIGDNSVIGACSVVTRSVPANSVAVGNPCRVIMGIDGYYEKSKSLYLDNGERWMDLWMKKSNCKSREKAAKAYYESFQISSTQ